MADAGKTPGPNPFGKAAATTPSNPSLKKGFGSTVAKTPPPAPTTGGAAAAASKGFAAPTAGKGFPTPAAGKGFGAGAKTPVKPAEASSSSSSTEAAAKKDIFGKSPAPAMGGKAFKAPVSAAAVPPANAVPPKKMPGVPPPSATAKTATPSPTAEKPAFGSSSKGFGAGKTVAGADKPTDKPADKPADKPEDKPADKPAGIVPRQAAFGAKAAGGITSLASTPKPAAAAAATNAPAPPPTRTPGALSVPTDRVSAVSPQYPNGTVHIGDDVFASGIEGAEALALFAPHKDPEVHAMGRALGLSFGNPNVNNDLHRGLASPDGRYVAFLGTRGRHFVVEPKANFRVTEVQVNRGKALLDAAWHPNNPSLLLLLYVGGDIDVRTMVEPELDRFARLVESASIRNLIAASMSVDGDDDVSDSDSEVDGAVSRTSRSASRPEEAENARKKAAARAQQKENATHGVGAMNAQFIAIDTIAEHMGLPSTVLFLSAAGDVVAAKIDDDGHFVPPSDPMEILAAAGVISPRREAAARATSVGSSTMTPREPRRRPLGSAGPLTVTDDVTSDDSSGGDIPAVPALKSTRHVPTVQMVVAAEHYNAPAPNQPADTALKLSCVLTDERAGAYVVAVLFASGVVRFFLRLEKHIIAHRRRFDGSLSMAKHLLKPFASVMLGPGLPLAKVCELPDDGIRGAPVKAGSFFVAPTPANHLHPQYPAKENPKDAGVPLFLPASIERRENVLLIAYDASLFLVPVPVWSLKEAAWVLLEPAAWPKAASLTPPVSFSVSTQPAPIAVRIPLSVAGMSWALGASSVALFPRIVDPEDRSKLQPVTCNVGALIRTALYADGEKPSMVVAEDKKKDVSKSNDGNDAALPERMAELCRRLVEGNSTAAIESDLKLLTGSANTTMERLIKAQDAQKARARALFDRLAATQARVTAAEERSFQMDAKLRSGVMHREGMEALKTMNEQLGMIHQYLSGVASARSQRNADMTDSFIGTPTPQREDSAVSIDEHGMLSPQPKTPRSRGSKP